MRLALALALLLAVAGASVDPWVSVDKAYHLTGACTATNAGYALLRECNVPHKPALWWSAGGTAAVLIGKELYDWRAGGSCSYKDLLAGALGAGVAFGAIVLARRGLKS